MTSHMAADNFPCGLVVTTVQACKIISANAYFYELSQYEPLTNLSIGAVFTSASKVMIESYVMPLLLNQKFCEEIQLTIKSQSAERIPVLVNARIYPQHSELIYWVITAAKQRDILYQELVNLRNDLELKAEKLEVLAQTDELTGLLNRRAFIEKSNIMIKQAVRHQLAYAFIMIDIDNFKEINDQHGHDVGDEILRKVSDIFMKNCRENDILARVGGEEFAIFTTSQSVDATEQFVEKLLKVIRADNIHGLSVTTSIGLAISNQATLKKLFKFADVLLYKAKNNGKNQFVRLLVDDV